MKALVTHVVAWGTVLLSLGRLLSRQMKGIELEKQGARDAAVPASKKPPPAPPLAEWQDFSTVLQK